jgi:hypothetical protein
MTDDRELERLENRNEEITSDVRRIERYLSGRERFWVKMGDRAFIVGAIFTAAIAALVIAERREP